MRGMILLAKQFWQDRLREKPPFIITGNCDVSDADPGSHSKEVALIPSSEAI
jgi:hypothetical protein